MKLLILISFGIFVGGCSKHTLQTTVTKFPEGQKLYFSKCASCHRLFDRQEYSSAKWDSIMLVMSPKAKTTNEQNKLILQFLKEKD